MNGFLKISKVTIALLPLFCLSLVQSGFALQDGLAKTPPMGWNSWNFFACQNINEDVVVKTAKEFVRKHPANWEQKQISLADVGYRFVTIDDCWGLASRNASGNLQINPQRFPHSTGNNSFSWLSDSIHRMGLKFGLYMSNGTTTCQYKDGFPGACHHENQDAAQYASWGVDFIKDDCCFSEGCYDSVAKTSGTLNQVLYVKMRDAIKLSRRPMILSLCEYGKSSPWLYGDTVGHLWRTNYDIGPSWGSLLGHMDENEARQIHAYAKPGAWNDPDMMEVGVSAGMSNTENQSHFDLWCITASPLTMGNDLSVMTEAIFTILSNREVIAVDQDSLGVQGHRVRKIGGVDYIDVYSKKLKSVDTVYNRKFAVVVLNRTGGVVSAAIRWSDFGAKPKDTFKVRDLWKHLDIAAKATDSIKVLNIPAHGTVHYIFTQVFPTSAFKTPVSLNKLSARLAGRTGAHGFEIYVPTANSVVQIFNVQGKMVTSFTAPSPSWYPVNNRVSMRGLSIMRVKTPGGMLTKELLLAR